jgi:hypothetical protein
VDRAVRDRFCAEPSMALDSSECSLGRLAQPGRVRIGVQRSHRQFRGAVDIPLQAGGAANRGAGLDPPQPRRAKAPPISAASLRRDDFSAVLSTVVDCMATSGGPNSPLIVANAAGRSPRAARIFRYS